jgi:hypothetical protein
MGGRGHDALGPGDAVLLEVVAGRRRTGGLQEGAGIRGMREPAMLIGATRTVGRRYRSGQATRQTQPRLMSPARVARQNRRPIGSCASSGCGQAPQRAPSSIRGAVGRGAV